MYEYTCPVCGVTKSVRYEYEVRTFCSVKCAGLFREQERRKVAETVIDGECVFQPESVMCYKRNCTNCGWNPVVAKARLAKFLQDQCIEIEPVKQETPGVWISVEERMPKDKVQVLAFTHAGKVLSLHCENGKFKVCSNTAISHWMPMPKPPEEMR